MGPRFKTLFVQFNFPSLHQNQFCNMKTKSLLIILIFGISQLSTAGIYMEFKFSFIPGKTAEKQTENHPALMGLGNRTMKSWYSDGNSRVESGPVISQKMSDKDMPPGFLDQLNKPMVLISLKNEPNKSFSLDETTKSYSVIDKTPSKIGRENKLENYSIVDLGKETVNGYTCNHLTIKEKGEKSTMHFWISKDIKGIQEFKKMATSFQIKDGLYQALEAKKLDGMMVRMKSSVDDSGEMQIDLVKIEEVNVPASKFSISGYTLKENPLLKMGAGTGEELSAEEKKMISDAVKGDATQIEFMENMIKKIPAAQRKMMIEQMGNSQK